MKADNVILTHKKDSTLKWNTSTQQRKTQNTAGTSTEVSHSCPTLMIFYDHIKDTETLLNRRPFLSSSKHSFINEAILRMPSKIKITFIQWKTQIHRNYVKKYFHVPLVKHFLLHSVQFSALTTFHPCYQTLSLNQTQPLLPPWVVSLEHPKAKQNIHRITQV